MSVDQGERELARLAQEQWADYKQRYQPIEYSYASKLVSDRPGEKARAIAGSVANAQDMASNLSKGIDNSLGVAGISPSSMRSIGAKNDMRGELGGKAGLAAGSSDLAMGDKRMSGILQAIRQGRGMASSSISGLTSSAISKAQNDALEQEVKNSISNSNWGLAGTVAGALGGAALRNYGGYQDPNAASMQGMIKYGL